MKLQEYEYSEEEDKGLKLDFIGWTTIFILGMLFWMAMFVVDVVHTHGLWPLLDIVACAIFTYAYNEYLMERE